ncbi:MAG: heavy-metal-associated domain-containing protein [Bacteroidales bacterium]|jgi:copper chaperone CopZ|nr:heavy-metal-associated domain-containing protein [Bacteroidales bacterium]
MKKLPIILLLALLIAACNNTQKSEQTTEEKTETAKSEKIEVAIIEVTGMHCDGCVKTVTNALQGLDGVQNAKVTLEDEQARVEFDPNKLGSDDLKHAIEESGYGVGGILIGEPEKKSENETGEPAE